MSALLALALTALVGVASASASGTAFTSESPSTEYNGYGPQMVLTAAGRTAVCETSLASKNLEGPQENLPMVNTGLCTTFGEYTREIKMNGCQLEFQPGTETSEWNGTFQGTYSIGPAGCGPITVELILPGSCQLSIPAQTGLMATYHDIGSENLAKVEVASTVNNLKYSGCGVNNGENGLLTGTWTLSGKVAGSSVGIAVKTLPHAPLFEADAYPITYNGTQAEPRFNFGDLRAECSSATLADTESGTTKALSLSASYSSCLAFGFSGGVTISTNGCHFVQEATKNTGEGKYSGPGSLTCPSGVSLEIVAPQCTVAIPAQAMGTLSYEDAVESGVYKVKSTTAAKGLTYNVTRDAWGCPFEGTGARTNGEYSAKTTFTGKNGSGETRKIRIGG